MHVLHHQLKANINFMFIIFLFSAKLWKELLLKKVKLISVFLSNPDFLHTPFSTTYIILYLYETIKIVRLHDQIICVIVYLAVLLSDFSVFVVDDGKTNLIYCTHSNKQINNETERTQPYHDEQAYPVPFHEKFICIALSFKQTVKK